MESNRFSERDTCTVNKGKNAAAVTDKKTRQDTAVNKKSHGLYSPSGEDISSKIQKIFLNGKEIDISTYTVTVDTIDASKIKAVSTKHKKTVFGFILILNNYIAIKFVKTHRYGRFSLLSNYPQNSRLRRSNGL